jgi:glycerol-1-phosphate dehydrogenase [NAD(P)+]
MFLINQPTREPLSADIIQSIVKGEYRAPGEDIPLSVPIRSIVIEDSLAGREAELIGSLSMGGALAVVSDRDTHPVLGARIERALDSVARVISIVLPAHPHADEETTKEIRKASAPADALIAVGSGTLNDLCKYAASLAGKSCAVFGTAPSMNGYASVNASISVQGMKNTLPAIAPSGIFLDLAVLAAAPARLIRSGLGDSLCRPTAQADWMLAHLVYGQPYRETPFHLLAGEEEALLAEPEALLTGNLEAMGRLARTLVLSGIGMTICGGSQPASQGEHLISHYVEMMGSPQEPQSPQRPRWYHGEQIAVTTLSMAGLQHRMLNEGPPRLQASSVSEADILEHFGTELGPACEQAFSPKRLDSGKAEEISARLEAGWEEIAGKIRSVTRPPEQLRDVLDRVDAPASPGDLGWPTGFYRTALRRAREIRNRVTFLDLAGDAGLLDGWVGD